jgi:hypothetical protein
MVMKPKPGAAVSESTTWRAPSASSISTCGFSTPCSDA